MSRRIIDRSYMGYTTEPTVVCVDTWRVKLFCQAIGETNPVHWDVDAARSAGHRGCLVPPTFLKAMESEHFNSAALLKLLQVPVKQVLHAEQSFEHLVPVYSGDEVTVSRRIADIYDKRDGALSFVVVETTYSVHNLCASRSVQTVLVRNEERGECIAV